MGKDINMAVELINLTKKYKEKLVLNNLSLKIPEGKIKAIMGASGTGKTTLLNIIMGLIDYDMGEVKGNEGRKSVVFQEDRLCMNLTAYGNIKLVNSKLSKIEIEENMRLVGLENCFHQPVRELSGGMKRRVAILRAILSEYDLLLLDEPFQGLDKDTKVNVINYVKDRIKGKTVIMVTHDIEEANSIGADIIYL